MRTLAQMPDEIERLRQQHYNATVTTMSRVHDDLAILRIRPDAGPLTYQPGQYTVLGLGQWEPRLPKVQPEASSADDRPGLIRRAYSISCRMLDPTGRLVRAADDAEVEFYVALVRFSERPPALTPRLFLLQDGNRIHLGRHCHGHYTLAPVQPDDTVLFMATGTGEAPHNAMLAELLHAGHRGPIVAVVCTRYEIDLAYRKTHRRLESMFKNYRYLTITTREPTNLQPGDEGSRRKRYLQDYFASGALEKDAGVSFPPDRTQVFLCGNSSMIGIPRQDPGQALQWPKPIGMLEILQQHGFQIDRPLHPGNVHFETYS